MNAKSALKSALLGSVDALTSRHTALLPLEARDERLIFALDAPYRVDQPILRIDLREQRAGQLTATLVGYEGHFPRLCLWTSEPVSYDRPMSFEFDLQSGAIRLAGAEWGRAAPPKNRRFCWHFVLTTPDRLVQRLTGHYRADTGRAIEKDYYFGEDYVDYDAQSAGEHDTIVRLFQEFKAEGPVLEFGCATGGTLTALRGAQYEAYGVDVSAFAIEQAVAKLGPGSAFQCDAERDPLPSAVAARGPFGAVVMWAVLEHFREPFRMVEQLRDLTRKGSLLFINTTNADSLSHFVLGRQWEGYFDWSHHGVDQISVRSMRQELSRLGWTPLRLTTEMLWAGDTDPSASTLRDWFGADARFRRLLTDKDLGDFITCVAVRQ